MKGPVKTILVVDDEPDAIELVEFNLRAAGYGVIAAEDGEEAIRKAREGLPDLIVLDVMLPEVDGMAACRTLKNDPITSDIPVIMLTARLRRLTAYWGWSWVLMITSPNPSVHASWFCELRTC